MENHLVVFPFAGGVREFSCLVGDHCLSWIVGCDINIFPFSTGGSSIISTLLRLVAELGFLVAVFLGVGYADVLF